MKKKLLVTLITFVSALSLVACDNSEPSDSKTDTVPVAVEEPVAEDKTFAEENNIEVVVINDVYEHTFTFIEYNKDGDVVLDADAQKFSCPTTVTKSETDNGDGTKTVIYTATFDIKDWSLEFDYYSSDTFFADIYTGKTITRNVNSIIFQNVEIPVNYDFEDAMDENYTTHTKNFILTCPVDYDGYALFLGDAAEINASNSCKDIADILFTGEVENRVFVK